MRDRAIRTRGGDRVAPSDGLRVGCGGGRETKTYPYDCRSDARRLHQLLAQGGPYEAWFFAPDMLGSDAYRARAWEDEEGNLLGVAELRPSEVQGGGHYLALCAHPGARRELEPAMLAWAQDLARGSPGPATILCRAAEGDAYRAGLLEGLGFRRRPPADLRFMERTLEAPVPGPALAPGYALRPFRREDVAAWMRLWGSVWDVELTPERRLGWLNYPSHVPGLDLVATAADGELAAFCVGSLFHDGGGKVKDDGAWVSWLGTAPGHRRRGLASALLRTALLRLQAFGCRRALLCTDAESEEAVRLYEAHGFHVLYRMLAYVAQPEAAA